MKKYLYRCNSFFLSVVLFFSFFNVKLIGGTSAIDLEVDTTSKAGRVTSYSSIGKEINTFAQLPTYACFASSSIVNGSGAVTDFFFITGAENKIVQVHKMVISGTVLTAALVESLAIKKHQVSVANAGESLSAGLDSNDGPPNALVAFQTTFTNTSGAGQIVWEGKRETSLISTAGLQDNYNGDMIIVDFDELYGKPITLNSRLDCLSWNNIGVTVTNTHAVLCGAIWTEADRPK